jgi:hypothetical protein
LGKKLYNQLLLPYTVPPQMEEEIHYGNYDYFIRDIAGVFL